MVDATVNQWLTFFMDNLLRALNALQDAEQNLANAVAAERALGKSWADIGRRLGITRQAAFKRFGTTTNILTGEQMTPRNLNEPKRLTEQFFTHVSRGEEELAMGMIHPTARKELPWTDIAEVWNQCLTEFGSLESITKTYVTYPGGISPLNELSEMSDGKLLGIAVGVTALRQEAGEVMGRVAFDQDNAIVGVLYLPTDTKAADLPF